MIEPGRVCIKKRGRKAGEKVIISKKLDENFVIIKYKEKEKKCNIKHLIITNEKVL